jgi:uncharacterized phage-associated protein
VHIGGGFMIRGISIAQYFLNKDPQRIVFTKNVIHKNGRDLYDGNARLNKYLHLAQNIYIAKTGEKLFEDDLYAYSNGGVVPSIQEHYSFLYNQKNATVELPNDVKVFLDKIYRVFENATLDELIEISHEDSEWEDKQGLYRKKEDQRMDSISRADEYREQYGDILKVMERM